MKIVMMIMVFVLTACGGLHTLPPYMDHEAVEECDGKVVDGSYTANWYCAEAFESERHPTDFTRENEPRQPGRP